MIRKLLNSLAGIRDTWKTELSFRQWLLLVVISDVMAVLWLSSPLATGLIVFSGFVVLGSELINTAIERVVDRFGSDWNLLAKQAKDAGSAMVFVVFLGLVASWAFAIWEEVS